VANNDKKYIDTLREKTARRNIPFAVHWELTPVCNLQCRHCYFVAKEGDRPPTLEKAERLMKELADAGVLFLVVSGGEPLTHPQFFEIMKLAKRYSFATKLMTNGTLITEDTIGNFEGLSLVSVDVSLYGREEIHDRITGVEGSWKRTMNGIRLLAEAGHFLRIKMPVMNLNRSEFEYVKAFANDSGFTFIFDATIICTDTGDRTPHQYRLSEEALTDFFRAIRPKKGFAHTPPKEDDPPCNAGRNTVAVSPGGDGYPCVAIKESAGNIFTTPFKEIWNSDALKKYRALKISDVKKCLECDIRGYCIRCPGLALVEDGDMFGPSEAACIKARALKRADSG